MKSVKSSYISGFVEIEVTGKNPENFLQQCARNGIMLWEIKKPHTEQCTARIQLKDVNKVRKLRRGSKFKIRFLDKQGIPFLKKRISRKKPLLIGLFLSLFLFFILSNMVWQVTVTGVPEELEKKITDQLTSYGVYPGALSFTLESPNQIQQLLLEDVPELLWVGVDKKGTSFYLEGVEKLIIEKDEPAAPRHLIADKSGVIQSMYVRKGLAQVTVNEVVEKGEILVSGAIEKLNTNREEGEDGNEEKEYELVAADGEVVATTWYRAEVTVPLTAEHDELTGNSKETYRIKFGSLSIPIWPLTRSESFEHELVETDEHQVNIFGWQPSIYFLTEKRQETSPKYHERSQEEAIQAGIRQVKNDLLRRLGNDAQIITEKVLHETTEHGKVNLSLYITVEENIAARQPINQGD
ncbi:sporulation protein YqfD [Oceanobacillus alkalisoli]|uniref:sporulation protein YqfD n=1 Tax=Oceanobacillus alkalisoli TaxID=2925113 RepID=UPI001EF0919D|nr:sporulation protein YqfD [Oceanobacillus alkalisoli]MCF3941804.1 sporulation protein YqfD [Oceanobacillus alkalisoli]MCG5103084.1 sporulation protein YqfD [Oceanobacillus alkalisoli]